MRIFLEWSIYPQAFRQALKNNPGYQDQPYSQQFHWLTKELYLAAFPEALASGFRALGAEVEYALTNASWLQQAWARENGFQAKADPEKEIYLEQLRRFQPDIWLSFTPSFRGDFRREVKREVPSIQLTLGWDGVLRHDTSLYEGCDVMVSCVEETASFYEQAGLTGHYFPHSFDPGVLPRLEGLGTVHPISFVGGVGLFKGGHFQRAMLLNSIKNEFPRDAKFWISGLPSGAGNMLKAAAGTAKHGDLATAWQILRHTRGISRLAGESLGEAYGIEMFRIMKQSAISLNSHIDATANAANIRLFEATGTGSCLLTDWKRNIPDFFEEDREVVTYKTTSECLSKLRYLLGNESERRKIAEAGQRRTLATHSTAQRVERLMSTIRRKLGATA